MRRGHGIDQRGREPRQKLDESWPVPHRAVPVPAVDALARVAVPIPRDSPVDTLPLPLETHRATDGVRQYSKTLHRQPAWRWDAKAVRAPAVLLPRHRPRRRAFAGFRRGATD